MFNKLVKVLFPSFIPRREISPDFLYFERTRGTEKTQNKPSEAIKSHSLPDLSILHTKLSAHENDFISLLFGESGAGAIESVDDIDPLSTYVLKKLEAILLEPQAMFEHLPVMPNSMFVLTSILKDKDFKVDELLKVIESEPSIAADVVKLANVMQVSPDAKQITNLNKAFMTMGSDGLLEGVVSVYIDKFKPAPGVYFKVFGEKIWKHSQQTAAICRDLEKQERGDYATAYFTGLLKNLGTMILFHLLVDAFYYVDPNASPRSLAFKLVFKKYSKKVTDALVEYWELPEPVTTALKLQNSKALVDNKLAKSVFEANRLSEIKMLWEGGKIPPTAYEAKLKTLLLSESARSYAKSWKKD